MIGVIIPAHDEQRLVGACLRSVTVAARDPLLGGEPVQVFVALDRCRDGTRRIAAAHGAQLVVTDVGNVGRARAAAARAAIAAGARWLASTDADTRVPPDWLSGQLAGGADAFCGAVNVDDWKDYPDSVRVAFHAGENLADGHPHVHGANLGIDAEWYLRVGGFAPIAAHEDVALVRALADAGARIARRGTPMVTTSARRDARAKEGFGDYLLALERRVMAATQPPVLPLLLAGPR